MSCFQGEGNVTNASSLLLLSLRLSLEGPPSTNHLKDDVVSSQGAGMEVSSATSETPSSKPLEDLSTLFPQYGEAFLAACLRAFDNSADRAIDAIFTVVRWRC